MNEYFIALYTDRFAMLYALRLRSYIPLARLNIFFRLLLALNPLFALGISIHSYSVISKVLMFLLFLHRTDVLYQAWKAVSSSLESCQ